MSDGDVRGDPPGGAAYPGAGLWRPLVERALVRNVVLILDAGATIQYASPALETLLRHRPADVVGRPLWDFVHADDLPAATALFAAQLDTPGPAEPIEVRARHADGSWRTMEAAGSNLLEDPALRCIVIVAHDVTERRLVERELLRLRLGIERSGEVVFLTDPDGRITYVNPTFEQVYGYGADEAIGQTPRLLKSGRMSRDDYRELWETLLARRAIRREMVNRAKDGRLLTVDASASPVVDRDGTLVGFLAIQRDVTERQAAEAVLRESEARFRALVEHAVYGIFRVTPDGRFLAANPALVELLGYTTEAEVLALDLARDVCAEGGRTIEVLRQGGTQPIRGAEVTWTRRGAGTFTARLSGQAIRDSDNRVRHFELLVEDVTARRTLEIQLQHSQRLDAIGQLTAGIAHDFNNILTSIVANAELVAANLPGELVDARADLRDITTVATRGAEMIKKLMAFSRREHLELESLDVEQLLREMAGMFRRVLPETIEITVGVRGVGTARLNRGAIEQILLNLATNARDAMPRGGTLRLEAEPVTLGGSLAGVSTPIAPGQYVRLTVSDTGVGMEARVAARVFEPFFTTKPSGKGTGLGLAMVYGLVKQQGGYITVSSAPRRGTRFSLYFPSSFPETLAVEDEPARDVVGGTENLLLVEDDEAIRRLAKRLLERFGYHVIAAVDGQEAADFLRDHAREIDLVISDVVMPRMSGPELLAMARAAGNPVRFLFTSGYAAEQTRRQTPALARHPYLHKPWTVAELLTTIREVLDAPPVE